jgi:hypothetical protein
MLCFRLRAPLACAVVCPIAAFLMESHDARACGACFHSPPPPSQVVDTSLVTDHRMAFSVSQTQSVLWDQIRYTGAPINFAWVLPIRAGARVELSSDAWLAALDASTRTVITGPTPACGGSAPTQYEGSGGGCMGSASGSAPLAAEEIVDASTPTVQVISQSVVGPYQAVTVHSSQGEALGAWLVANGYDVPPALQPTIDAYTSAGFDFIALKLAPGEGVQAMQPVRVVTPGADLTLPLRMVAAGIGAHVGLELYVVSEGRYHPQNFPDATIDFTKLAWDPHGDISNYSTLMQNALATNGGTGWLTESSGPADLGTFPSGAVNPGLAFAYGSTCVPSLPTCSVLPDAGAGDVQGPSGTGSPALAMCSSEVSCDDLAVGMNGIQSNLWVTRLRADLPAAALATDLILEATASQTSVTNMHSTQKYTDPSYNPCGGTNAGTTSRGSGQGESCAIRTKASARARYANLAELSFGGALMALALRRRRGKTRPRSREDRGDNHEYGRESRAPGKPR